MMVLPHPVTLLLFIFVGLMTPIATADDPQCKLDLKPGMLEFYKVGNEFVKLVQPKSFPIEEVQQLIDNANGKDDNDALDLGKKLMTYEIGYLVLIVIGASFVIFMPLIGMCFCCCRWCDSCGGKMFQKEPVSTSSCVSLTVVLFILLTFMLSGVVMFSLNAKYSWDAIVPSRDNANFQINRVINFMDNTVDDVISSTDDLFNNSLTTAENTMTNLADSLIGSLKNASEMDNFLYITSNMSEIVDNSNALNSTIDNYNGQVLSLTQKTVVFANDYNANGGIPQLNTSAIQSDLSSMTNPTFPTVFYSMTQGLETLQAKLNFTALMNSELKQLENAEDSINSAVNSSVQSIKDAYASVAQNEQDLRNQIGNITDSIKKFQGNVINASVTDRKLANHSYGFQSVMALVAPFCLILLCTLFGLCCGPLAYEGKRRPFERTAMSNAGGCCLFSSVVISFMFTWIIMFVTMILFTIGFFTQTLLCTPIFQDPVQQAAMFNLVQRNVKIGSTDYTFNFSVAIDQCRANKTLYSALELDQVFNISSFSSFADDAIDEFNKINLNQYFNQADVYKLDAHTNASLADATSKLTQIQVQLTSFVRNHLDHDPTNTVTALNGAKANASNLTALNEVLADIDDLKRDAMSLASNLTSLNSSIETLLTLIQKVQSIDASLIANQTLTQVNIDIGNAKTSILYMINTFVNQITALLQHNIGNCRPIYDIFMCAGDIVCKQVLYPLQGVWIALGWCLLWSVPALVVATKLSRYFRAMDPEYYKPEPKAQPLHAYHGDRRGRPPPAYGETDYPMTTPVYPIRPHNPGAVYPQ